MKSSDLSFLREKSRFEDLMREHIARRTQIRTLNTQCEYRLQIRQFRRWWLAQGEPKLDREVLLTWMLDGVRQASAQTVWSKVFVLDHFFAFLVKRGLLPGNPLRELRQGYQLRGYCGIVRDLQRTDSVSAVLALAEHPFSGPLGPSCLAYLDFLAALGKRSVNHRCYLMCFERVLRQHNVTTWSQVDQAFITTYLQERKIPSAFQHRCWLLVLEDFFRFLIDRGEVTCSPVPPPGPHRRRSLPPRIFSNDEVRSILAEAGKLPDHRLMPFRGQTYRMLFLTLYTLGLRISEALNLRLGDLDFTQHSLTIGQTKFYKGRVLPFGPRYEAALHAYIDANPLLRIGGRDAFLFPTDSQRTPHLVKSTTLRVFHKIVDQLGITTPMETRPPNLHSFRHSFAVHWMERWLRAGADVQAKLPLLSAFLGHGNVAATQVYLTMTPERLSLICKRFEDSVRKESEQ